MTALLQWITGHPARAFLAAALASLVALLALPMAAWLPAGVVVLAILSGNRRQALVAAAGCALAFGWAFGPAFGVGAALAIAAAVLLPSWLGANALVATRSLSFVFQALTLGAVLLLLAIYALLGDPQGVMQPVIASELEPMLRQTAQALSQFGIESSPQEIGEMTARIAWRSLAWMVLLQALLAQFAGLWAYGRLHQPGLFGREFRGLRLGRVIAWLLVAAFAVSLVAQRAFAPGWQAADDAVFLLAAAFLVQALAVVHGLRELQVIGTLPLVLAYLSILVLPSLLVAVGFADTWLKFRERFVKG